MAKYLILIYGDERQWAAMSAAGAAAARPRATAPSRAAAGTAVLDGQELEPASIATTLRADPAGRLTITDGPFLETKEAVGGYYLIEAADLDEVIGSGLAAARGLRRPQRGGDPSGGRVTDERRGRRGGRAGAPPRLGPGARRDGAPDPGPRSRGGVHPGRVRPGAADLAADRHPGSARRVAHDHRPQPGAGRAAPGVGAAPGAAAAGVRTSRCPGPRTASTTTACGSSSPAATRPCPATPRSR